MREDSYPSRQGLGLVYTLYCGLPGGSMLLPFSGLKPNIADTTSSWINLQVNRLIHSDVQNTREESTHNENIVQQMDLCIVSAIQFSTWVTDCQNFPILNLFHVRAKMTNRNGGDIRLATA